MTKTYELSNERMIMADVDEEHHMATVSVYVLDDLVKEANKADVIDKIRAEIAEYKDDKVIHAEQNEMIDIVLEILDKYR